MAPGKRRMRSGRVDSVVLVRGANNSVFGRRVKALDWSGGRVSNCNLRSNIGQGL